MIGLIYLYFEIIRTYIVCIPENIIKFIIALFTNHHSLKFQRILLYLLFWTIVVEIINQQRNKNIIIYKRYNFSATKSEGDLKLDEKIDELERIFEQASDKNGMGRVRSYCGE